MDRRQLMDNIGGVPTFFCTNNRIHSNVGVLESWKKKKIKIPQKKGVIYPISMKKF